MFIVSCLASMGGWRKQARRDCNRSVTKSWSESRKITVNDHREGGPKQSGFVVQALLEKW